MARPSWEVVNPSLGKPEKEAVVPKEFEHPRRTVQDVAVGPQGRSYMRTRQTGFFILLRWLIGFFLPQHIRGFLPINLQVSLVYGVVCVGHIGSVSDVKQ